MLSITGMTLEQFSDLMGGLGYKGEKAERAKVKAAAPVPVAVDPDAPVQPIPEGESAFVQPDPEAAPAREARPVKRGMRVLIVVRAPRATRGRAVTAIKARAAKVATRAIRAASPAASVMTATTSPRLSRPARRVPKSRLILTTPSPC